MHLKVAIVGSDAGLLEHIQELLANAADARDLPADLSDDDRQQRIHLAAALFDKKDYLPVIESIAIHTMDPKHQVPASVARDANLLIITDSTIERPDNRDVACIRLTANKKRPHHVNDNQSVSIGNTDQEILKAVTDIAVKAKNNQNLV